MQLKMILVLFILLVIVTNTFCIAPAQSGNDSSEILSTNRFYVYNETTGYRLRTTSISGDFLDPAPPPHTIYPRGNYRYEVTTNNNLTAFGHLEYDILDNRGFEKVGSLSTTYRAGYFSSPNFINTIIQGPFRVSSDSLALVVYATS